MSSAIVIVASIGLEPGLKAGASVPTAARDDAADDYLIALARRESVHTLITGDKAVLAAPAPDLLIQTPRQFVDLLSAAR